MILAGPQAASIAAAADTLRAGGLLGLPTETVYGLAADAQNPAAVARIFSAKGRPAEHPLIVHVLDAAAAAHFASEIPAFAQALMQAFWPGPLTLILPRRPGVAGAAAGGQDSIGLRCPAHPVALGVLAACAGLAPPMPGLAVPSANRFGRVSPTTAAHVREEFGPDLLVLDAPALDEADLALLESSLLSAPATAMVLLSPDRSSEFLMRAMRAGVREVIPSPSAAADLSAAFARQLDEDSFLVVALDSTGIVGKLRYLARTLLQEIREAL